MARMTKVTSTAAERKADEADMKDRMDGRGIANDDGPELSLNHHHLNKLDMGTPSVGDEVEMRVRGKVTHSSSHETDGNKTAHVRVAVTHAAVENSKDDKDEDRAALRQNIEAAAKNGD